MILKEYVERTADEALVALVVRDLGYLGWEPAPDTAPIRELLDAIRTVAVEKGPRVLMAFPYWELRDRVLYTAASVFDLMTVLALTRSEDLDAVDLSVFAGLPPEEDDEQMLWDMDAETVAALHASVREVTDALPAIALESLTVSQLAGVVTVEMAEEDLVTLIARYLAANGKLRRNEARDRQTKELADRQYLELGYLPDQPLHGPLQEIYNAWSVYRSVTGWRRRMALAYQAKRLEEERAKQEQED